MAQIDPYAFVWSDSENALLTKSDPNGDGLMITANGWVRLSVEDLVQLYNLINLRLAVPCPEVAEAEEADPDQELRALIDNRVKVALAVLAGRAHERSQQLPGRSSLERAMYSILRDAAETTIEGVTNL